MYRLHLVYLSKYMLTICCGFLDKFGFLWISGDCVCKPNIIFLGFINITIYTLCIYLSCSSLRTIRILISKHPHWGTWYLLIRPKTLSPYGGVFLQTLIIYICVVLTCILLFTSTSCIKRWFSWWRWRSNVQGL